MYGAIYCQDLNTAARRNRFDFIECDHLDRHARRCNRLAKVLTNCAIIVATGSRSSRGPLGGVALFVFRGT